MIRFAAMLVLSIAFAAPAFANTSPEPHLEAGKHLLYGEQFEEAREAFHQAALRSNPEQAALAQLLSQIAGDCVRAGEAADWEAYEATLQNLDVTRIDPQLRPWIAERKAEVAARIAAQRVVQALVRTRPLTV